VGYVSGPGVKRVEAASLITTNDDDVHGMFFFLTRKNTLNLSSVSLHETFSGTLHSYGQIPSTRVACLSTRRPIGTLTQIDIPSA